MTGTPTSTPACRPAGTSVTTTHVDASVSTVAISDGVQLLLSGV